MQIKFWIFYRVTMQKVTHVHHDLTCVATQCQCLHASSFYIKSQFLYKFTINQASLTQKLADQYYGSPEKLVKNSTFIGQPFRQTLN